MLKWGREHFVDYPWRARRKSAWISLLSEVLLQRTRADQVVPVYSDVAVRYPEPGMLAREKPDDFSRVVHSLGLHWRAPLMLRLAEIVADRGAPPDSYDELVKLPGVGPYAAAAYLSMHRERRAAIADSNVVRLLGRIFNFEFDGETRRKRWLVELADSLTPARSFRDYNFAILDLAMTVCRPRPACDQCPVASLPCAYYAAREAPARRSARRVG